MATIQLGKIKQVWRGTYNNSTAYTVDDLVEYTDSGITSTYICVTNSTGNAPSSSGTAHASWNYVAKGVTDPIPTQSGNTGKFLKTDGSSLSFADAGGWVQIAAGNGPSSAVTDLNIDNIFSATYKYYKVYIKWTQDDWLKCRLITASGVVDSGAAYTWVGQSSSENTDSDQRFGNNAQTYGLATYYNGSDNSNSITELTFGNPHDSATEGVWFWNAGYGEGAKMWHEAGSCINTNNASYRGIYLSGHNGDSIADSNFNYVVLGTGI